MYEEPRLSSIQRERKGKKNTFLNKENQSKTTDYSLKPYPDDQTSQKVGAKTYISHLHTIHYTDFCEGCESKKSEIAVWARTRAREMQPKRKQKSETIMCQNERDKTKQHRAKF